MHSQWSGRSSEDVRLAHGTIVRPPEFAYSIAPAARDFHSALHKQLAFLRFRLPKIFQRHVCQQCGIEANAHRAFIDPESIATGRLLGGPIAHETVRLQSQQAVIISQPVVVPLRARMPALLTTSGINDQRMSDA
jgi:hypothetical protein